MTEEALALKRHFVFAHLIHRCLNLTVRHAREIKREWNIDVVKALRSGIRSAPSNIEMLVACSYLSNLFDLHSIAGFYTEDVDLSEAGDDSDVVTRWRLNLRPWAILRPYRNQKNWIQGLMIYRHGWDTDYRLLTSRGLKNGTGAVNFNPLNMAAA